MVIGTKKQNPYDKIKLRPKFYRNQLFKIDFMLKLIILANKRVSAHEVHKVFSPRPESTKQMEQTLRAKVKIFLKNENFKKCF